jgi:hypothetical protein
VGIVWPGDPGQTTLTIESGRLAGVARALAARGLACEGVVHHDATAEATRARLLALDAALVWVNPLEAHGDRRVLDALLAEVAAASVLVSAHPDTIQRIGTKEVLYRTREMAWGCDTRLYRTWTQFRAELPRTLATSEARVLKQYRGNGGEGVWKIALAEGAANADVAADAAVAVRHARRGSVEERVPLATFLERCRAYFVGEGRIIDQAFQHRLVDGMVRCYLVGDRVEGFGEQKINALFPAARGAPGTDAPQPGPRHYFPPTRPDFQHLKHLVESAWVAQLCGITGLTPERLPLIWDLDFLYGPKDASGRDTYVLCEINVSCVFPFPDSALAPLAAELRRRLEERRASDETPRSPVARWRRSPSAPRSSRVAPPPHRRRSPTHRATAARTP